jgi:uncharacterized protein
MDQGRRMVGQEKPGESGRPREGGSLLGDTLRTLTRVIAANPRTTLWVALLTVVGSVLLTVRFMDFKTSRSDLIDPAADFHQRWLTYTESFGDASDVVVVVESTGEGATGNEGTAARIAGRRAIEAAIDDIGNRLRAEPDLFHNVLDKVEPSKLSTKGLQYLTPPQLQVGLERLEQYGPVLDGRWELVDLDSLVTRFDYQLQRRTVPRDGAADPVLLHTNRFVESLTAFRAEPQDFRPPWPRFVDVDERLRDATSSAVYFLNDEATLGFVKVRPGDATADFQGATAAIDRLRTIIAEVEAAHEGIDVGLTGIPVLENDEMRRSQTDMLFASVISFVGVGLLLFLGFRGLRHPALAMVMLAVGMAWAFGYTTLAIGHLNILSVSFAVILIGLGIDFSIHYLARYLELRRNGEALQPALVETSSGVGIGIVTAAVTTALAFFCATFTQFLGVAELGVIAGGGIVLCAAATFLVLPALVAVADKNVEPKLLPSPYEANGLRSTLTRMPFLVTLASIAVIVGVGAGAFKYENGTVVPRIRYDSNLLNLQAKGLESVEVQRRVFEKANASVLYAVSLADSPDEARRLRGEFEKLPTVARVEELATRLPAHPSDATRRLLQAYRHRLSRLPESIPRGQRSDPGSVGRALERLHRSIRNVNDPYARQVARSLDLFLDDFERMPLDAQIRFLSQYQLRCKASLLTQFQAIRTAANDQPVTMTDLPPELASRFVGRNGKWLVQVYPKEEVWDGPPLEAFVADVRSVDPNATGTPLQNYEASRQIRASYEKAAIIAFAVVVLVLLVDFIGREHKLLVLVPALAVVMIVAMTMQTRRADPDPLLMLTAYVCLAGAIAAVVDFKNLRDALLALLPAVAGAAMMFGVLGLLGVDLNPANLIVLPLVLGIGVDDGVHVVHDFRMQQAGKYRPSSSTINAVVLTSLTSMVGFGSMMIAAHRGLYSVGLVLVVGVGSCLLVAMLTLPAILVLLSGSREKRAAKTGKTADNDADDSSKRDRDRGRLNRAA